MPNYPAPEFPEDRRGMYVDLMDRMREEGVKFNEAAEASYRKVKSQWCLENLTELSMKAKVEDLPKLQKTLEEAINWERERISKVKAQLPRQPLPKAQIEMIKRKIAYIKSGAAPRSVEPHVRALQVQLLNLQAEGYDITPFEAYLK